MKIVKYGLYHTEAKMLVGVDTDTINIEYMVVVEHSLRIPVYDAIWLVDSREEAERVVGTNASWYDRGYKTPENPYVGKLKVVEVILEVDV